MLSVLVDLSLMSFYFQPCLACPALTVLFLLLLFPALSCLSCFDRPVFTVLLLRSWYDRHVAAVLTWLSCPGFSDFNWPFLIVLLWLSRLYYHCSLVTVIVMAVLSWLYCRLSDHGCFVLSLSPSHHFTVGYSVTSFLSRIPSWFSCRHSRAVTVVFAWLACPEI